MIKKCICISMFFLLVFASCNFIKDAVITDTERPFNGLYTGEYLNHIAFPIGGIGAGMVCLEGTGALSHVLVYNKPAIFNEPKMFAALSVKGLDHGAKVLEGPVPDFKIFGCPNNGNGTGAANTSYGLPRFNHAEFESRFPFGMVKLKDADIPMDITITGWSPFIPLDADDSSLPCGALEYTFRNTGKSEINAVYSYNSEHIMRVLSKLGAIISIRPHKNGFILSSRDRKSDSELNGDFALFTTDTATLVDHCWFRGRWFDPISITWKHIEEANPRISEPVEQDAPGASLYIPFKLMPGEIKTITLLFAWYVPNTSLRIGEDVKSDQQQCSSEVDFEFPFYRPWYASKFKNIHEVTDYWMTYYDDLKERTELFTEAFYSTTLPDEVIEAVAANLTILKSPTVLRQYDGKLWGWEGCMDDWGSCHGSCTHVWNYAQAIPHLFPSLERSLRETEFLVNQDEKGHQAFRASLPIRKTDHGFHAAADGQLGGIMKAYREWRISGDDEWLGNLFPFLKKSMEYCIKTWDPRETGTLEEPHHNTYDIEFWGPNGMSTSFYLGALRAIIIICEYFNEDTGRYQALLDKGTEAMKGTLFNGEYFHQRIMVEGLHEPSPIESARELPRSVYSDEALVLLETEGPKYQYGTGCLSDGILGMWMARVCGICDEIIDTDKVISHLESVYKYNFRTDLSDHPNPQRPAYALKHEAGLLLCTWPKGDAPSLPFVYSNEVWTGIEYQVASHLSMVGLNTKAMDIVRACRQRYDGRIRNPFNEYECGHWYARAMASYGLIQGLTGVRYDAVTKTLYIDSRVGNDFDSFFSCNSGFGNIGLKKGVPYIRMVSGSLYVEKCIVSGKEFYLNERKLFH